MGKQRNEGFDVLIVGGGPAGSAAAIRLAQAGRRVCILDAAKFPRPRQCGGWISAAAADWLPEIGLSLPKLASHEIKDVQFWNADFSRNATPQFAAVPAYLVDRGRFDEALLKRAAKDGAEVRQEWPVADIDVAERQVTVSSADGRSVSGRLLIYATGRDTRLMERLGIKSELAVEFAWAASVELDRGQGKAPRLSIVLGLDASGGFAVVLTTQKLSWVSVHLWGGEKDVIPTMVNVCRGAHQASLLGTDLSQQAAAANPIPAPAGLALSMDTHVCKHALIVGDAGGFVAAASGEGIFPGMRSGKIAADVVHKALDAPSPQDVLMEFNGQWRRAMAEYLRPPNTDTQYILPLIFSNQPMADRVGAAFFSGENL